jgi:hypothetical protein
MESIISQALKTPHELAPTDLRVGDKVTFTNHNGVSFSGLTVIGFANPSELYGKSVYLDYDCYWYPATLASLTLEAVE